MMDVTVDDITRRDIFCASRYFRINFMAETRKREEFVSRQGGEKGRQKRANVGAGGYRFTRI